MGDTELKMTDILALEPHPGWCLQRTLMAWVRTALSMISFGFTIYKFLQVLQEQSTVPILRPQAPRNWDFTHRHRNLCGHGRLCSTLEIHKKLRPDRPYKLWTDLTFIVACLIGCSASWCLGASSGAPLG